MKKLLSTSVLLLLFTLASIAQTGTTYDDSLNSGGVFRTYKVYKPSVYDGTNAVPLLLNFHGLGSNNNEQMLGADFRGIADTANFIMVLPNGTAITATALTGGLGFDMFGDVSRGINDVNFVSELLDSLIKKYNIDTTRIYATGMSNGGFMAYELACHLSDRVTAVASVTGSMQENRTAVCNATHPIPVMQIHGTTDGVVDYNGGSGAKGTIFYIPTVPVEDLVDFWVAHNNTSTTPTKTDIADTSSTDGSTVEHYVYSGGSRNATVELFKIIGGGHQWPGDTVTAATAGENRNMDFSASKEIWRFFSQQSFLADASSIDKPEAQVTIYPNPSSVQFTII